MKEIKNLKKTQGGTKSFTSSKVNVGKEISSEPLSYGGKEVIAAKLEWLNKKIGTPVVGLLLSADDNNYYVAVSGRRITCERRDYRLFLPAQDSSNFVIDTGGGIDIGHTF